jgi:hypothetical protein
VHSVWAVCQQCNSLRATTYTPDDGPCETEACRVIMEERHEMGVVKPRSAWRTALKTVFVYVYQEMNFEMRTCALPEYLVISFHRRLNKVL